MNPAFKEWALVCEALGCGSQSIIIRKGGIAEGRKGFSFEHREFCLFPTWFHEQLGKTKLPSGTTLPPETPGEVFIHYTAVMEWSRVITDRNKLNLLRDHHIWADEVLEERFAYDDVPGVHLAFVRVFRLEPPVCLPMEKHFGGCRSWVELPDFNGCASVSVLPDEEHERRRAILEEILG